MAEQKRLLTLNQVSKNFGGVQAVKNLSFHINSNEIIGLIMLKSWGIKKLPHPRRQFFSEQFA